MKFLKFLALAALVLLFGCVNNAQIPSGVDSKGVQYRGAENAKVVIVEFSDFQCPYCAQAEKSIQQILRDYDGKVKLVYRHFPLRQIHENAQGAAVASECAAAQGKFWQLHDLMYENQGSLDDVGLDGLAGRAGLDVAKFDECIKSGKMEGKVEADLRDGMKFGVRGTPTFFVGGAVVVGGSYSELKAAVDAGLAK